MFRGKCVHSSKWESTVNDNTLGVKWSSFASPLSCRKILHRVDTCKTPLESPCRRPYPTDVSPKVLSRPGWTSGGPAGTYPTADPDPLKSGRLTYYPLELLTCPLSCDLARTMDHS